LDQLNQERFSFRASGDKLWHSSPNSLGYWQKIFLSHEYSVVWVEKEGKLVAFAVAYSPEGRAWKDLSYLYVSPEERRHGIGKFLVGAIITEKPKLKDTRVWVKPKATSAIKLFEAAGFEFYQETSTEKIYRCLES